MLDMLVNNSQYIDLKSWAYTPTFVKVYFQLRKSIFSAP